MSRSSKQKLSTSTSEDRNNFIDNQLSKIKNQNIFDTVVVTDFVANPEEYLESNVKIASQSNGTVGNLKNQFSKKVSDVSSKKSTMTYREYLTYGPNKVINSALVEIMPRNSILGINITGGKNKNNLDKEEIFFPFFSHISLPVKVGEQVWIFYDNVGGRKIGYWLSRKVGTIFVDDLNYTHIDRHAIISTSLTQNLNSNTRLRKEKVNTFGMTFPNPSFDNITNKTLHVKEYDDVLNKSFAHDLSRAEFIGEPVPRYSKKCADLTLQGSNNTIITMTHEKDKKTGTIQVAVGRNTISKILPNIRTDATLEHEEVDKLSLLRGEIPDLTEGDINGEEAASLLLTENFGGLIELKNSGNNFIQIIPNDSSGLSTDGGIVLHAAEGKFIRLGGSDAEESAVLGNTLADILSELINNLLTISLATGVGPSGPLSASVDGGGAKISGLLSRIESIKSATTKVK